MKTWVLDTNVIVAAHLSPHGPPAHLLQEVYTQRLRLAYDARIAIEYRTVLRRDKFDLPRHSVDRFLTVLADQDLVDARPLKVNLPDEEDRMFLEVAHATAEMVLVTGNHRHFPRKMRGEVTVLSPAEAWARLRR